MKKIHLNRAQNGQRKTLFFLAAKKKKLTILFALLCASMLSWAVSQDTYLGCDGGLEAYAKSIKWYSLDKVTAPNDVVSIQKPGWAGLVEGGIYVNVGQDYDGVKFDGVAVPVADYCYIQGTGGILYISKFVNKCTSVEFTKGEAVVRGMRIQNDKGTGDACATGSGGGSTPEPTAFSIIEVWPTDRVTATTSGDDILVKIASYGGGQWQGQVKLQHNVSFENTKTYKVGFTLTADKDCGGITFKTDDNQGEVYENQSINLTASTPYYYEKIFKGQAGNNKIMVFDFGLVGDNTNITISNLTLVEYSPATASSTNGDLIPFLAVDGNTGTRWQAASKGEAWWKMDYGTSQSFNRVNITWENSYAKSFTIQGSNDDESYTTLATVSGQTISGFPYKQVIDLDQLYNYRYVKFVGTENGNDYGFSFYEFEIMEVETSVLTDVVITSPRRKTVCPISSSIDITAEARDQYDMPMDGQTITYSVSPASAGTIDANGHYTASQVGEATITASCSDKQASYVVVNTISANLALNKPATAGANETPIANANDADLNSLWALGPNRPVDDMWWRVDLEETYDLSLVIIKWDGACPTAHAIQVSSDDANWTDVTTLSGWPVIGGNDDHNYQFYPINAQGRYIRVKASALRENGWGMKIFDFQAFGTVAASPTKSVSASVNDPAMGSASVTQNDDPVTEVATGSTVTFSATPKDGYVFVNWSNGETRATFDAVVNSAMNLTATFRALGTTYCNTEMTANDHTVYVTMKRSDVNEYTLTVRSAEELSNFGGTAFYRPENIPVKDVRNEGVLSDGNHTLSVTMESEGEPYFGTPLYVVFAGVGEVTYNQMQNVRPEYAVACDDAVSVTSITLSQTSANLLVGHTLTLTPTFTPTYATDRAITWETSNASVATINNGEVKAVAEGNATITAKLTSDNSIYATCDVHVIASLTEAKWHGYAIATTPTEGNILLTYSVTRDVDQHLTFSLTTDKNMVGFVTFINIAGAAHELTGYGAGYTATYTTSDTYEDNVSLNCMWDVRGAGYGHNFNFTYMVGSKNDPLKTLALSETQDNTSVLAALNGQEVAIAIVNRSFTAGNLYTLVLPFNVDAAQTATNLPGQLTKLNNSYEKANGDLRVNFVNVDAIEAGVPYLYKPSADVINPAFVGVSVSATLHPTETDNYAKYYGIYAPMNGGALHDIDNAYVLGPDQYLYAVSDLPATQTMDALRAYFVLNFPSAAPGAPKRLAKVVFNENETETTTDIEDLQTDNTCTKVIVNGQLQIIRDGRTYNAQGQLVK